MANDQGSGTGFAVLKGALLVLGALAAIGLVVSIAKPLFIVAALGGIGYLGYRMLGGAKALGEGKDRKALPGDDDFERRMRELDAMDKRLDAEIRKHR